MLNISQIAKRQLNSSWRVSKGGNNLRDQIQLKKGKNLIKIFLSQRRMTHRTLNIKLETIVLKK